MHSTASPVVNTSRFCCRNATVPVACPPASATGGVPIPTHSVDAHSTACPSAPSTDFASAVIASPATEETAPPTPLPIMHSGLIPQPNSAPAGAGVNSSTVTASAGADSAQRRVAARAHQKLLHGT